MVVPVGVRSKLHLVAAGLIRLAYRLVVAMGWYHHLVVGLLVYLPSRFLFWSLVGRLLMIRLVVGGGERRGV